MTLSTHTLDFSQYTNRRESVVRFCVAIDLPESSQKTVLEKFTMLTIIPVLQDDTNTTEIPCQNVNDASI